LHGNWELESGSRVTSDRNAKNNIKSIPKLYEVAFDNFEPTIFKYNDGTSDRYHTGFIAQEVDDAIQKAGLSRKDFAALCISNKGTEYEHWGLRYSEFVALNTWQIQKLKPRMTAAEQEIASLKLEIQSLRAELENLKNS
jgi:hypothetical protein